MRKMFFIPILLIALIAAACGSGGAADPVAEPPAAAAPTSAPTQAAADTPEPTAQAPAEAQSSASAPSTSSQSAARASSAPAPSAPASSTSAPAMSDADADADYTGGVFNRTWSDPPTLDPHITSDTTSAFIVQEVFSGLVTLSPELQIVPDIAESWDISEDGTVYTFRILDDARFHDGSYVTAEDFVYSLNRAVDPALASPVASTYLDDIVGAKEALDGTADSISGVKAIDERTLQITIDAPKAYFLAKLTYPTAFVVDRDNVEAGGDTWTDNPNGTGPFVLKEYRIGERLVLERNSHFYREPARIDQVRMNLAGGQSMAMYENDEIDITGVSLFDLDRLRDPDEPLSSELHVAPPGFSVSYVGFNVTMPPFDDPDFRRALNHAVDKQLIADEVLSGLRVPAYGILPPGFPGYADDIQGLEFNEDLAKEYLAKSKYADPATRPRIVVSVSGTGGDISIDLQVVLEMWERTLGVEVEIQQVEWATYLQDLNRRKFQVFVLGWNADYPDPQDFLDILFYGESENNHTAYDSPEVNALLERARVESDPQARVALYNQAEQRIIDDAAWLPLWYTGERNLLLKPHIKGYVLSPMTIPKMRYVYIDEDSR